MLNRPRTREIARWAISCAKTVGNVLLRCRNICITFLNVCTCHNASHDATIWFLTYLVVSWQGPTPMKIARKIVKNEVRIPFKPYSFPYIKYAYCLWYPYAYAQQFGGFMLSFEWMVVWNVFSPDFDARDLFEVKIGKRTKKISGIPVEQPGPA